MLFCALSFLPMANQTAMFFGAGSALKVEMTNTRPRERDGREIPGTPTVTLHATREQSNPQGTRYNWEGALSIQVGKREITDVMAVLCHRLQTVEFRYHGVEKNKSYSLVRAGELAELSMSTRGEKYVFKLAGAQRLELLSLCFRQWQRQQGGLSADVLFSMLESAYS